MHSALTGASHPPGGGRGATESQQAAQLSSRFPTSRAKPQSSQSKPVPGLFFICYFKDHIFAAEMKVLRFGLSGHLLKRLPDSSASMELIPRENPFETNVLLLQERAMAVNRRYKLLIKNKENLYPPRPLFQQLWLGSLYFSFSQ